MMSHRINADNRSGTLKPHTNQTAPRNLMHGFHTNSNGPREGPQIAAARANGPSGPTNSAGAVSR